MTAVAHKIGSLLFKLLYLYFQLGNQFQKPETGCGFWPTWYFCVLTLSTWCQNSNSRVIFRVNESAETQKFMKSYNGGLQNNHLKVGALKKQELFSRVDVYFPVTFFQDINYHKNYPKGQHCMQKKVILNRQKWGLMEVL